MKKQFNGAKDKTLQRFAELIVLECIRIDVLHRDESPGDAIIEHFGVKE